MMRPTIRRAIHTQTTDGRLVTRKAPKTCMIARAVVNVGDSSDSPSLEVVVDNYGNWSVNAYGEHGRGDSRVIARGTTVDSELISLEEFRRRQASDA